MPVLRQVSSLAAFRVHNYLELFWMGMRYVLWHYAFGYMGLAASFRLYSFYVGIGATYIFTNFAVSHTHKDMVPTSKHISWTLYSANHTTNCTPSWWCDWCARPAPNPTSSTKPYPYPYP